MSATHVVVGAYGDDDKGDYSGSAYIFQRDGAFVAKLTAPDGSASDYFGYSVATSATHVVVSAYGDMDKGPHTGSAYVYVVEDVISGYY